jgi:hypothetical protein
MSLHEFIPSWPKMDVEYLAGAHNQRCP